jgi:hypothetical protein
MVKEIKLKLQESKVLEIKKKKSFFRLPKVKIKTKKWHKEKDKTFETILIFQGSIIALLLIRFIYIENKFGTIVTSIAFAVSLLAYFSYQAYLAEIINGRD